MNKYNYLENFNKRKSWVNIVIDAILYTFIIWILIFLLCYSSAVVYDISMQPTLNTASATDQDVVYYTNIHKIERGDIVILAPEDSDWLIKRVVAFEGEKIRYEYNQESNVYDLYINNELYLENYVKESITPEKLEENNNLKKYLDITDLTGYNPFASLKKMQENNFDEDGNYIVPKDTVFVMGDNRIHSTDSKSLGGIEVSQIKGKVELIIPKGENLLWEVVKFIF